MKILAYNINLSSQEKIDKVLGYNADVYILPEVACPSQVKLPEGYRMEWMGDFDYKGLGIIWKSNLNAEIAGWFNPKHQYFLPILIDGKLIMAAWPTTTEQANEIPSDSIGGTTGICPILQRIPYYHIW